MSENVLKKNNYRMDADSSKCAGCMVCMLRCSLKEVGMFQPCSARLEVMRIVDAPNEFEVTFTSDCDACGICAAFCPYGALHRNKTDKED